MMKPKKSWMQTEESVGFAHKMAHTKVLELGELQKSHNGDNVPFFFFGKPESPFFLYFLYKVR